MEVKCPECEFKKNVWEGFDAVKIAKNSLKEHARRNHDNLIEIYREIDEMLDC